MAEFTGGGGSGGSSDGNFPAVVEWAPSTAYLALKVVYFAGSSTVQAGTYQRLTAGTSGTTFDPANWRLLAPAGPVGPAGPTPAPATYIKPLVSYPSVISITNPTVVQVVGGNTSALRTHDKDTSYGRWDPVPSALQNSSALFTLQFDPIQPSDPSATLSHVEIHVVGRTEGGAKAAGTAAASYANQDSTAIQNYRMFVRNNEDTADIWSNTTFVYSEGVYYEHVESIKVPASNDTKQESGAPPTQQHIGAGLKVQIARVNMLGQTNYGCRFTQFKLVAYYLTSNYTSPELFSRISHEPAADTSSTAGGGAILVPLTNFTPPAEVIPVMIELEVPYKTSGSATFDLDIQTGSIQLTGNTPAGNANTAQFSQTKCRFVVSSATQGVARMVVYGTMAFNPALSATYQANLSVVAGTVTRPAGASLPPTSFRITRR